jgi:hypothetical protein
MGAGSLKILLSQRKQTVGQQGSRRISAVISTRAAENYVWCLRVNRVKIYPKPLEVISEEKSTSFAF